MEVDQCPGSSTSGTIAKVIALPQIDENNALSEKGPKERMVEMLDMLETHVEHLRKEASRLEEEKDGLLASLDTIRHTETLKELDEFDKEDVLRYGERIMNRCHTIEVHIRTPRDQTQEEALYQINHLIDGLVVGLRADPEGTKSRCLSYMNACSSHYVHGITDKKFECALLGCTLDDQKRVKKRLQGLLNYFDKLERDVSN
ncbi:uncharacterized protein CBL_08437 [Carabus blaptoides fortunei]